MQAAAVDLWFRALVVVGHKRGTLVVASHQCSWEMAWRGLTSIGLVVVLNRISVVGGCDQSC